MLLTPPRRWTKHLRVVQVNWNYYGQHSTVIRPHRTSISVQKRVKHIESVIILRVGLRVGPESARPNTPFPFKPQDLLDSSEMKQRLKLIHANTLKIRTRVAKKQQSNNVTSGNSAATDSKTMSSGEMVVSM